MINMQEVEVGTRVEVGTYTVRDVGACTVLGAKRTNTSHHISPSFVLTYLGSRLHVQTERVGDTRCRKMCYPVPAPRYSLFLSRTLSYYLLSLSHHSRLRYHEFGQGKHCGWSFSTLMVDYAFSGVL